jgi:hypothetical protein
MDTSSLKPSLLIPIAAGAVVLLGVITGFVTIGADKRRARRLRDWARGAYGLWTGGEDSGGWEQERASRSLGSWYGATGPGRFWELIKDLEGGGQTGNLAWDEVRALDLLRIGRAAQYIDDDACWTEAAKIARRLRRRYKSWDELAAGFEQGMNAWQQRSGVTDPAQLGRVQKNLPALRKDVWPRHRYHADLPVD